VFVDVKLAVVIFESVDLLVKTKSVLQTRSATTQVSFVANAGTRVLFVTVELETVILASVLFPTL
jgi:predicted peptidase